MLPTVLRLLLKHIGGVTFYDGAVEEGCGLLVTDSSGFTNDGC